MSLVNSASSHSALKRPVVARLLTETYIAALYVGGRLVGNSLLSGIFACLAQRQPFHVLTWGLFGDLLTSALERSIGSTSETAHVPEFRG